MKKWLVGILVISICLNLYQFGKSYWESLYTPNEEDYAMLGEMTKLVIESKEYQKIGETEKIHAITTGVDRNKGGAYPFHYGVIVKTDKQSYIFSCKDNTCSDMELGGWTYSRYSDEKPVLPLNK